MSSSSLPGHGTPPGTRTRCRACGARMRPEEDWCSLCHQSVLDEAPAEPEPEPQPDARPAVSLVKPEAGRPTDPAVLAEADRLLAVLAAAEAERTRESGFSLLQGRFAGPRGGAILAVSGGVLLLVVGMLGLTLLGLFL